MESVKHIHQSNTKLFSQTLNSIKTPRANAKESGGAKILAWTIGPSLVIDHQWPKTWPGQLPDFVLGDLPSQFFDN